MAEKIVEFGDRTCHDGFNALVIKKWDALKPQIIQFRHISNKDRMEDNKEIQGIKTGETYKAEKTEAAITAEYAIPQLIEDDAILGESASIAITSEFDDIKRGVDCVIRFQTGDGEYDYEQIGFDIKTNLEGTKDHLVVKNALHRTVEDAKRGKMRQLKYFIDPQTEEKLSIEVPVLIVVFKNDYIFQFRDILGKPARMRTFEDVSAIRRLQTLLIKELILSAEEMIHVITASFVRRAEPEKESIIAIYQKFIDYLSGLGERNK